jgi:hypothetical protein
MLNSYQTLAVPAKLIEHGMINLKREALFYDKIIVATDDAESETQARGKIGFETSEFLEENGILSFEMLRMFSTDDPPPTASEVEIALVAAWKIAFMEEVLSTRGSTHIDRCRQLQAQAHSRLAALQLHSLLPDSHILPIDYGYRWRVDLEADREHDEFESKRYERAAKVDPPLNKWNYYLDLFNKGSNQSYANALSVIVEGISVTDEHSNWGDIIDFREKMENRLYIYRMRKKLLEISESGERANLFMELASERGEFDRKMLSLKRKNRMLLVKSVLSFTADILPNIVKLNWGKIAEGGIDIVDRTFSGIDSMMELESNGMYYLHRVEQSFV